MEITSNYKMSTAAASLIEALRDVLNAESKALAAYLLTYGDTIPENGGKTPGELRFSESGLAESFDEVKSLLRTRIGETIEGDLNENPEGKEGVC